MVKPESYKIGVAHNRPALPEGLTRMTTQCVVEGLERRSNGSWYALGRVVLHFQLDDGRAVVANHKIQLRGVQEGKRPNPNPFGRKNGKKKAGRA